ncbi:hypothetical protein ACFQV2_19030 [Actinokineospora soli]|uniref:AAA+ ATPase domain-containing protein n=1 Tax=Actinokineospora soli TaxID=1048753 RepID=A0ABW2TP58_9PSEU
MVVFFMLSTIFAELSASWSEDTKGWIAVLVFLVPFAVYAGLKLWVETVHIGKQYTHEQALEALETAWRQTLLDDGVLPVLRRSVNDRLPPQLRAVLDVVHAPHLARPAEVTKTVATRSIRQFQAVSRRMSGGAVGIAGPRGVGKSTLIAHQLANDPAPVKVVVSAPVQYQARDFVLHLYAALCGAVLDLVHPTAMAAALRSAGRRVSTTSLGLMLLAASAAALAWWTRPSRLTTPDTMVDAFHTDRVATVVTVAAALVALSAVAAIVVGVVGLRLTRRRLLEQVSHPHLASVVGVPARERLTRIRFLQTRTTGWSGKLALPVRAEAGWTRTLETADRTLTYPEIVAEVREFLHLVVAAFGPRPDGVVLVAVDELDKIESAELAQQFLNEIKGVFGVDGTRFLVSVSDDALATYERRAAVRDAFDSAFDEIVRIEHLTLEDTRTLLRGRVVGLAEPFIDLVHCLSGGLARDVVRIARSMVALGDETDPPGLAAVCSALVDEDVRRITHGLQLAASQAPDHVDTTDYLRVLRSLRVDAHALLESARAFDAIATPGLEALARQSAAFAYHDATVLALFDGEHDTEPAVLDLLADARQALGAHPRLAVLMIDDVRAAHALPGLE